MCHTLSSELSSALISEVALHTLGRALLRNLDAAARKHRLRGKRMPLAGYPAATTTAGAAITTAVADIVAVAAESPAGVPDVDGGDERAVGRPRRLKLRCFDLR